MNPDPYQEAWKMQPTHPPLAIDADRLLAEVREGERTFAAMIFLRDAREVGVSLVMIPIWIVMGVKIGLPWTWYLTIPGLVWIAAFMLIDRRRQRRKRPAAGESLRGHVEESLAQVEHQIWLLRNVVWWYLLPLAIPIFAFFGQVSWRMRHLGGWEAVAGFSMMVAIVTAVFGFIAWLNQAAVRSTLEPRRQELVTLLQSLGAGEAAESEGEWAQQKTAARSKPGGGL